MPSFLQRAFAELRPTLEGLGFSLAVEHFDHEAFGSVYVEYRRPGQWIRIIWDGKESALLAQVSPAQENVWTDVEAFDRDLDDERIERLRDAIERSAKEAPSPTVAKTAEMTLDEALRQGPPPPGNLAVPIFRHGSLEVEMYTPVGTDPQTPHARDEVYVIARGAGVFFNGRERREVQSGSFIFVPAGQEHRFESFSPDFAAWVFFYGPPDGR